MQKLDHQMLCCCGFQASNLYNMRHAEKFDQRMFKLPADTKQGRGVKLEGNDGPGVCS